LKWKQQIAKWGSPFTDSEYVKRCLLAVAEEASSENLKMTASLSELVDGNYNKNGIILF
jgi:hypothetical protein